MPKARGRKPQKADILTAELRKEAEAMFGPTALTGPASFNKINIACGVQSAGSRPGYSPLNHEEKPIHTNYHAEILPELDRHNHLKR